MRTATWVVGVASLALALSACGTNSTGATTMTGVAHTATLTSAAGTDSGSTNFTDCMRANGVTGFPGVTIDQNGQVHLNLTGSAIDPISATYREAAQTCAHLLPAGSTLPAAPQVPTTDPQPPHLSCAGADCPAAPKVPAPPN